MKTIKIIKYFLILCFSVSIISCSNDDIAEAKQSTIILKDYLHSAYEVELLNLVNQNRISKDLNTLIIINEISYLASTHNDYMIEKGVASHDNFEQRKITLKSMLSAIIVGENVAVGFNTPESTLAAWKNNPSHNYHLEGDYTHYGLSVKADANGKKYYTLLFIRR
jgi:uncharacterized protein YkwD